MYSLKNFILCLLIFLIWILNPIVFATSNLDKQITVSFVNIKTRDLLHILAKHANKSVLVSEKIGGKVSVNLHQVSWREVLDTVLRMQGLVKQESASVIMIASPEELAKQDSSVVQPAVFNLYHASADNISKILGPAGVLSSSGKVGAETRTNRLVVTDTNDKIEALKHVLKQVDIPVKQVLIEARIVSADEQFVSDLGLEFGLEHTKKTDETNVHHGKFNFAIAKLSNGALLDLELAALESEGRGRVISSPKLLTLDRQAAYIESGAEVPYQEKTKEGDTSISFKKAVLSLKVTPEIVAENAVNLLLQLNQDKVSQLTINGVPAIDTRKIQTQVLVQNGETIVLGGIYEWSKSSSTVSIPVLGKIPLFGMLFRKQATKTERKELLMFVTPRII